jgi:hypothetical protein
MEANLTLDFTAIEGQNKWLIASSMLELAGLKFVTSAEEGGSYVIHRSGLVYPLDRGRRGEIHLVVSCSAAGTFDIPAIEGAPRTILQLDSGAQVNCAGARWRDLLQLSSGLGTPVMGVGGNLAQSLGRGTARLRFRDPSRIVWRPGRLARWGSMAKATRVVSRDVQRREVSVLLLEGKDTSPPAKAPGLRESRHRRLATADEVVTRLHLTSVKALKSLHLTADGADRLSGIPKNRTSMMSDAYLGASFRRNPGHHSRTRPSIEADSAVPLGKKWHMDLLPHTKKDVDGFSTGIFAVEECAGYVGCWPMRDKTHPEFTRALGDWLHFARTSHPSVDVYEIWADSDSLWTVSRKGDDTLPKQLKLWCAQTGEKILWQRSSAYLHSQNRAENAIKRVFHCATANLHQGRVTLALWGDAMMAACAQVNVAPQLRRGQNHRLRRRRGGGGDGGGGGAGGGGSGGSAGGSGGGVGAPRSPFEIFFNGRKPDVSRWLGTFAQPCFMLDPAGRNLGDPKFSPALYIMPSRTSAGSLVRKLDAGLKCMQTGHLAFPTDPNLLSVRVAESRNLLRVTGPLAAGGGAEVHRAIVRLFDDAPVRDYNLWMVRFEPLLGLPARLEPAFDPDTGEPLLEMRREGLEAEEPSPAHAPTPPAAQTAPALQPGPAQPRDGNGSRAWLRTLPDETAVVFDQRRNKRGASGVRWTKYSAATSLGQLRALQPSQGQYLDDLAWDLARGLVRLPGQSDGAEGVEPALHGATAVNYATVLEGADEAAGVASNITLRAIVERATEAGHEAELERDLTLARRSPTMRSLLRFEALEGAGGPPIAGGVGQLVGAGEATAPREVTELVDGTGLQGWDEVFLGTDAPGQRLGSLAERAPPSWGNAFEGAGLEGFADVMIAAADEPGTEGVTTGDELIGRVPIRGVAQAQRHPEWARPNSLLKAACKAELVRVLETPFPGNNTPTILVVPFSRYREDLAKYGPSVVQIKSIVMPIRAKHTPGGEFIKVAARVTYGDVSMGAKAPQTYSACVGAPTVLGFANTSVQDTAPGRPPARLVPNDVPGAYYMGTPPAPHELGGRSLFAPVPRGWDEFGYHDRDQETGERNLLHVVGNLPGRAEAGVTWNKVYTKWMLEECRFSQSIVDRQLFYLHDEAGALQLACGIHVDDGMTLVLDEDAFRVFEDQWIARFGGERYAGGPSDPVPFLGLEYTLVAPGLMEITGRRLFGELCKLLRAAEAAPGAPRVRCACDVPMPPDALTRMRDEAEEVGPKVKTATWSLFGMIGYLCVQMRADAMFAYVSISQRVGRNMTPYVFRLIIQLGRYLESTRELPLTFRRSGGGHHHGGGGGGGGAGGGGYAGGAGGAGGAEAREVAFWADSSANNGDPGSWGGYCANTPNSPGTEAEPTSGVVLWRALTPRRLADGTVGCEGILATYALKALIGQRVLLQELGLLRTGPTRLMMDALGTLRGVEMERVSQASKYLATRVAMLRQAVRDNVMEMVHVPTDGNLADIFTKALVGKAFHRLRAMVMGLAPGQTESAMPRRVEG